MNLQLIFLCLFAYLIRISYEKHGSKCFPEGLEMRKFNFYYTCYNGTYRLRGCMNEYAEKLDIGQSHYSGGQEWVCTKVSADWAQMIPLTCWYKGKSYAPSEFYADDAFWYTCVKTRMANVEFAVSGCVNRYTGEKLTPGQSFQSGAYIYTCESRNGTMKVEPAACIFGDKKVVVGDELVMSNYAYACNRRYPDHGIEFYTSACVFEGRKYDVGKQYIKNGFIFKCHKFGNQLRHLVVGCIGDGDRWYSNSEKWIYGNDALKYIIECVIEEPGGRVMKKAVQCFYDGPEGTAILNPACMKRFNDTLVQCVSGKNDSLEFRVSAFIKRVSERHAYSSGFKYC